jgi:Fe-S oxidoreductase
MLTTAEKLVFALVLLAAAVLFLQPLLLRYRIVRAGRPENRFDRMAARAVRALGRILFQRCTLRSERIFTGLIHVCIFYGALTFDTMTVNHTLEGFLPDFNIFGRGRAADAFSLVVDAFAVLVLAGVLFFAVRRFIVRPKAYATTPLDSAIIYSSLVMVTLSYVYFEAFSIAHHPGTERLSFIGTALAGAIQAAGMTAAAVTAHFKAGWWLHVLFVYAFIAYVPRSKYLHMFTGSLNLVFRDAGSGRSVPAIDLEGSEIFGLEKAADLTWKDRLDAFACMECGRCQDACPAYRSDKPLSPKMIVFDMEEHLLEKGPAALAGDRDKLPPLVPGVHAEDEIWTCTTCGACMHVCPVEIEHIPKIVRMRQSRVLMESKFPAELNAFFRGLETNANPWNIGFAKRTDWAAGLDIPILADKPGAEHLFWVGCAGSFDEDGKSVARAFASLLKTAGVDFAILGAEEKCCGDAARRLGNEYLFQTLAAETIELFASYKIGKVLTICPHGFNAFRNEYPKLLDKLPSVSEEAKARFRTIEVVHHAEFLAGLVRDGRLPLPVGAAGRPLTYHDPCYLGRHNGIFEAPRELLSGIAGCAPLELAESRAHSFCCGAGGGLMWTDETLGRRINHLRADQVIASGAGGVATACPFCQTMLRDALKDKDRSDIAVKDIAVLLAEASERRPDSA